MTIGVLVTARMGSSRLPDKHLRLIDGRAALSYLLARIEAEFATEIRAGTVLPVLATGDEQRNRALAALCDGTQCRVFHGASDNVPRRHLQAAEELGLAAIVSVDGDDLFCAAQSMRVVHDAVAGDTDLTRTSGLPLGMNCWGYSQQALRTALRSADLALLETGWGRIFRRQPAIQTELLCPNADAVRATLDYEEDLRFFTRAICEIPDWARLNPAELVREIIERNIHLENAGLSERYWENFRRGISAEGTEASA